MEVSFSLVLPDVLYRELIAGCRECNCAPRQFALESLEGVLANRRLTSVEDGRCGPRIGVGGN
jgi:hypothetical protein